MIGALRAPGALLAALALWALCLLVLAVAGLGGRVGVHPDDAALAPPLPQVDLVALQPRLGPITDYGDIGNRPLMSPDRRPAPVTAVAGDDDAPLAATLTGVLIAGDVRLAIVERENDPVAYRVRIGEVLEGTSWRLIDLQPRLAVFEGPQGRRELGLRVFDGTGGQAPTPPPIVPVNARPPLPPVPVADASASASDPAVAAAIAEAEAAAAAAAAEQPAEMTPEQQVEAIRRRIEARRAMRAQENAGQRAANEGQVE